MLEMRLFIELLTPGYRLLCDFQNFSDKMSPKRAKIDKILLENGQAFRFLKFGLI